MSLNQKEVDTAYETAIYNLALGVDQEALLQLQYDAALADEYEVAQGVNLALMAWEMSNGFNASMKVPDELKFTEDNEEE